jgi:ABC-2 type transport system permease protein
VNLVVFTLAFPVILLFIFGSIFKNTIAPGVTFSQYFVAGMASGLVSTGFQAMRISIPMSRDFGTLEAFARNADVPNLVLPW